MLDLMFSDPRDYLTFEFELRKTRRPAYSLRAFARDLAVSPSSLNDFLKGRVGMSTQRIQRIATVLRWSEARIDHFQDLIWAKHSKDPGLKKSAVMRTRGRLRTDTSGLSLDAFRVICDWYHLVILELCGLRQNLSVVQIADGLAIDEATARGAVNRLIKLGLLKKTANGFVPSEGSSHFGDETPSEAIVEFHCQILDLAQRALRERTMGERESHSLIYSVKKENVARINRELKKAILTIVHRYSDEQSGDCIQALSLQVFPVWEGS